MEGYLQVLPYFSDKIRAPLAAAPSKVQKTAREIRLRQGRPISLVLMRTTVFLTPSGAVTDVPGEQALIPDEEDLRDCFQRVCGYSVQSCEEQIRQGFLTLPGGHRVGISGTAVQQGGKIAALREVSSMNFRVARSFPNISGDFVKRFYQNGLPSILLSGAPMSGKTTLLKDIISALSSGKAGKYIKVAVIDERGELGAVYNGTPQIELGPCTDVLTGYPKGEGMNIALRTMSPELIVCDEIGGEAEADAIRMSLNAGTAVLATAHAGSLEMLMRRPQIIGLIKEGAFDYLVQLEGQQAPCQIKEIRRVRETNNREKEMTAC